MKKPVIGVTTSFEDKNDLHNQTVNPFYIEAVKKAGGEPLLLDFLTPLNRIPSVLEELDGVLLIGGGDYDPKLYGAERDPKCGESCLVKDHYELELTRQAAKMGVPVLGVCRGVQTINVAFGGTLFQHVPDVTGKVHQQKAGNVYWHDINTVPGTLTAQLIGKDVIATNSYHHQAADKIGEGLRAGAYSKDGIVESLESLPGASWVFGLQWHPERTVGKDDYSIRFFEALVAEAAKRQRG